MGGDLLSELSPGPEGSTVQTSTDYVCCAARYIRVRVDPSSRRSECCGTCDVHPGSSGIISDGRRERATHRTLTTNARLRSANGYCSRFGMGCVGYNRGCMYGLTFCSGEQKSTGRVQRQFLAPKKEQSAIQPLPRSSSPAAGAQLWHGAQAGHDAVNARLGITTRG